jgi:hypothetical protein
MKIRKCIKKYVIVVNRRLDCIYLTRENSEFHYSSVNAFPCWICNFEQAKKHIKKGIELGLTFSVIK